MKDGSQSRRAHWIAVALVALLPAVGVPQLAWAEAPGEKVVYTLKDLIQRALATSPEIRQFQRGAEVAMAKKDQADAGRLPQIELTAVVGPSPRARGTIEGGSPDRKDTPVISNVFERIEMRVVQPLYTFGKITGYREAAAEGLKVEKGKVEEMYFSKLLFS